MDAKVAIRRLSALAQESRLAVFRYLVECGPEGAVVGSIAERLGIASTTLSFHLKELSHAELLLSAQEGRFVRYTANLGAVQQLVGYLTENCCGGDASKCMPICVPAARPLPRAGKPRVQTVRPARARRKT